MQLKDSVILGHYTHKRNIMAKMNTIEPQQENREIISDPTWLFQ